MIVFKVRDKDHPDYHPRKSNQVAGTFPTRMVNRRGKMFDVGGVQIELFTVEVLAEAIDRKSDTIITWEKAGVFPKPVFQLSVRNTVGKRRLYSAVQVMNLHHLLWGKYQARKKTLPLEEFLAEVKRVFYAKSVCVDEEGTIHLKGPVK